MNRPLRSSEVAELLDSDPARLLALVRRRRIKPAPPRNSLGHFEWSKEDVERARKVIGQIERARDERK